MNVISNLGNGSSDVGRDTFDDGTKLQKRA